MTEDFRHEAPDVAELRRLAEAATPGPWSLADGDPVMNGQHWTIRRQGATNPHAWADGYAEAMAHILDTLEAVVWDTPADTIEGTQTVGGLDSRAIGRVVRLSRFVAYGPLTGVRHGEKTTVLEWATGHGVWGTQGAGVPSSTPCVVEDAEGGATP